MFIEPSDEPTHYSSLSSSLLDFFLTSNLGRVKFMQQIRLPGITDHDLIFIVYECSRLDYRFINYPRLLEAASGDYWDDIYYFTDVDSMVGRFNNIILSLFERFVPVKQFLRNVGRTQWLNEDIRRLMYERDLAFRLWKRSRDVTDRFCYQRSRNRVTVAVRNAKSK